MARAFDLYGSLVFSLAKKILVNEADAEEILQDVFVSLWKRARQFDPSRGSLAGYLLVLTRTGAIDRLRYQRARPSEALDVQAGDTAISSCDYVTIEDARGRVGSAILQLPPDERRVLELAYFEGLSQSEIAERTGAPLGTVKGRARNALRRLRESLPKELGGSI